MDIALKLPIGIEDFREIRRQGFYYIDKTKLIEQLLDNWGEGESIYQTTPIRKNIEYEYAPLLF